MSAIALDPLIAEAKRRAHRRRFLLSAAAAMVVAGVVAVTFAVESGSDVSIALCATSPSGWKERTLTNTRLGPPAVVLTDFRFGRLDDFYGLSSSLRWPHDGVMVAVSNEPPDTTPRFGPALRVASSDFQGFEGLAHPAAQAAIRSRGRVLHAYVEVGAVTPATVAAANAALAGIRFCTP